MASPASASSISTTTTPLTLESCVRTGNLYGLEVLVFSGGNTEAFSEDGELPMHIAAELGYSQMIRLLHDPRAYFNNIWATLPALIAQAGHPKAGTHQVLPLDLGGLTTEYLYPKQFTQPLPSRFKFLRNGEAVEPINRRIFEATFSIAGHMAPTLRTPLELIVVNRMTRFAEEHSYIFRESPDQSFITICPPKATEAKAEASPEAEEQEEERVVPISIYKALTPLHLAIANGHLGAVQTLCELRADISIPARIGDDPRSPLTALELATKIGDSRSIKALLAMGPTKAMIRSAGMLAHEHGKAEALALLNAHGANLDQPIEGLPSIRTAALNGNADKLKRLIQKFPPAPEDLLGIMQEIQARNSQALKLFLEGLAKLGSGSESANPVVFDNKTNASLQRALKSEVRLWKAMLSNIDHSGNHQKLFAVLKNIVVVDASKDGIERWGAVLTEKHQAILDTLSQYLQLAVSRRPARSRHDTEQKDKS